MALRDRSPNGALVRNWQNRRARLANARAPAAGEAAPRPRLPPPLRFGQRECSSRYSWTVCSRRSTGSREPSGLRPVQPQSVPRQTEAVQEKRLGRRTLRRITGLRHQAALADGKGPRHQQPSGSEPGRTCQGCRLPSESHGPSGGPGTAAVTSARRSGPHSPHSSRGDAPVSPANVTAT